LDRDVRFYGCGGGEGPATVRASVASEMERMQRREG
jgi:hypothetical protein